MAYTKQPKKLLIINILDILEKYTDEDHRLSQKDIVEILKTEYMMNADRKSVKRNLMDLIDFGYEIEYSESVRMVPNPKTGELEESYILSDFYLVRDFTDGELRLLIDSLLFSKHIPYSQCKELIEKLEGLSNQYFKARVKHIRTMPDNAPQNRQLFLNIETIDEAITSGRQVSFNYNEYGTDKKMHPRKDKNGNVREYIINPYQIAATNGRYYLICNYDKYDDISHYRIDRISNIEILNVPSKSKNQVKGLVGLDVAQYMNEHISEKISLQDILKKYSTNRNHLNNIFIQETSMTCLSYLEKMRINLAKIMLSDTELLSAEIAARFMIF